MERLTVYGLIPIAYIVGLCLANILSAVGFFEWPSDLNIFFVLIGCMMLPIVYLLGVVEILNRYY